MLLWRDGHITIASVIQDASKGNTKSKGVGKAINKATGKESVWVNSFSKQNWSDKTDKYMKSILGLQERTWKKIIELALPFVTSRPGATSTNQDSENASETDERAHLVNISDFDSDN